MEQAEYWSITEIAKVLGCTRPWAWHLVVKAKAIPGKRIGFMWFARPQAVRNYIEKQATKKHA